MIFSLAALPALSSSTCADDDDDDKPPANAAARQFVITEQQFDQMVFGGRQTVVMANGVQRVEVSGHPTATAFRERMDATVASEIEVVDRRVSLTEDQKRKLKLAARGDIAQFVSRANELRPKLTTKPMDQQQYVELMRELQPLRMAQQTGIMGDDSLFRKTLRHSLTDEQRLSWRTLERERQKAVLETVLQTSEQRANGFKLTGESRQKFIDVLLEYGDLPETRNSYIYYVVLVEAGKLEDRLKPLMSEEDWGKLQTQITQAKQVEATLRNSGQWPARATDDEVAAETLRK